MGKYYKPVFGIGINDLERDVTWKIDGKRVACPIYRTWQNMLGRSYDTEFHKRHPSYINCSVIDGWIHLSEFEKWMLTQDWEGKQLDKDIILPGNKIYSPETCAFVDKKLNLFIMDTAATRGEWPIGVSWSKRDPRVAEALRTRYL